MSRVRQALDDLMFPGPKLSPSEVVQWRVMLNHGKRGGYGGILYVTTERLAFIPSRLSQLLLGRSWTRIRSEVQSVTAAPPDHSGPLQARVLEIESTLGGGERFISSAAEEVAERLRKELNVPPRV